MFLTSVTNSGATPMLINVLTFNEARLGVIAENVANSTTPGYRARQLDTGAFQRSLRRAQDSRGGDRNLPFVVNNGREARTADNGTLRVTPALRPSDNVLFHDGTNVSVEREMADLAETGMVHDMAATLLRGYFDGVRKAIRGSVA